MMFRCWIAAVGLLGACLVRAEEPPSFERDIRPIFKAHCFTCHGEGKQQEANLDLRLRRLAAAGGDSGPAIEPGKPDESLLYRRVRDAEMPPDEKKLTAAEIARIKKWIAAGAPTLRPEPEKAEQVGKFTEEERRHWAFQPLVRPRVPAVDVSEPVRTPVHTPIDAFVLAKLKGHQLTLSPEADRQTLIRRATFDLIGLPPTPAEVRSFVADASPDAYERLIDRLLASPAYGERWGRHWLDLARYADSGGFHDDLDRPHAWRYRDYVIDSFNDDKPYGQFVREQLAGDEIAPGDVAALVATGFSRNGPSNDNNMGPDKEKYRLDQMDEVISTTSAVFLGLTIGCARCHDHKFDPLPQTDYYRFLAIFDQTVNRDLPLDGEGRLLAAGAGAGEKPPAKLTAAVMAVTEAGGKLRTTYVLHRGEAGQRGAAVEPGVPEVLSPQGIDFGVAEGSPTTLRRRKLAEWLTQGAHPLTWRVVVNRVWQHHFGRGLVSTASNFGLSGERPTHPELLDWLAVDLVEQGESLKRLHKQIMLSRVYRQSSQATPEGTAIDVENRLLGRMNKRRLESEALRDTVLAVAGSLNPAAGGPGVKPRIPPELLVASQRNKWPVVKSEGPEHWRRSVYVYVKRQLPLPLLELFDTPNTAQTCACRDESTVPTQALVMMNDQFAQDQAAFFAERVLRDAGASLREQAEQALWLAFSRQPESRRVNEAIEFLEVQQAMHRADGKPEDRARRLAMGDLCHVLVCCNEFVYID